MDAAKREQRTKEKLAALLGIEVPKQVGPTLRQQKMTTSREAEAVLKYTKNPDLFREANCNKCNKRFAVNRANVAYCSDVCRAASLADLGIEWDWSRPPEQRWGIRHYEDKLTNEPLIITEAALDVVKQALARPPLPRYETTNDDTGSDSNLSDLDNSPVDDIVAQVLGRV